MFLFLKRLYLIPLFLSFVAFSQNVEIVADQNYYSSLLKLLTEAEKSANVRKKGIDVIAFSWAIDSGGIIDPEKNIESFSIVQKLIDLKAKFPETSIRVFIENNRDTSTRNHITATKLKEGGIEVYYGSTHAKGFRVGDKILFGSTNLTAQSMRYNNETNVLVDDSDIAEQFQEFVDKLSSQQEQVPVAPEYKAGKKFRLLENGAYKQELIKLIRSAESTIDVSIYYFNDKEIEKALIDAHKRGIAIRLYINTHQSFGLHLVKKNEETAQRLRAAGITDVYFDQPSFFSHSKYLIRDKKEILLGTGNWNNADINIHPQLYFQISDPFLADQLSRHLSTQIAWESSREIPKKNLHRFWLGWVKPGIDQKDFDQAISDIFATATIVAGQKRGLVAYHPVLPIVGGRTLRTSYGAEVVIPDEIALISYQDAPTYSAIREMPLGREYGPLHGDFFDLRKGELTSSSSSVPLSYDGKVNIGDSFHIEHDDLNWKKQRVQINIWLRSSENDEEYEKNLKKYLDKISEKHSSGLKTDFIDGYLINVQKHYIVEYVLLTEDSDYSFIEDLVLQKLRENFLNSEPSEHVEFVDQNYREVKMSRHSETDGARAAKLLFDSSIDPVLVRREAAKALHRSSTQLEAEQAEIKERFQEGNFDSLENRNCEERLH